MLWFGLGEWEGPCVGRGATTPWPDTAPLLCSTAHDDAETIHGASLEVSISARPGICKQRDLRA
jgi:hypothetical protein